MTLKKNEAKSSHYEAGANDSRRRWLFGWGAKGQVQPLVLLAYLAVVALFIFVFASFYVPGKRFSHLVVFGENQPSVVSALDGVDYYEYPNSWGYDGQFYAQIAMDPTLQNPELRHSIDSLAYRGRRILMSFFAYVMGLGSPAAVLHMYTLQNPIAWFLIAILMLWWFPPSSFGNWFRWTGVLFCCGMWASIISALTDGPSVLWVALGVFLIERNRPWLATAVLGLSGLWKETNILGASAFAGRETLLTPRAWPKLVVRGVLILVPLELWLLYIRKTVGLASSAGLHNFSWPLSFWFWKLKTNVVDAFSQDFFSFRGLPNFSFLCLLGLVALTVQFAFFVFRPQWDKPWWRVGISYSVLMAMLGQAVWEGYSGAAFRVLIPMQLAFNVLVPRTRRWLPILILGNLSVLTEIHVVLDKMNTARAVARIEHASSALPRGKLHYHSPVSIDWVSGWLGIERSGTGEWVWSSGQSEMELHNQSLEAAVVRLSFSLYSLDTRDFTFFASSGETLYHADALKDKVRVTVEKLLLPPGKTVLKFETRTAPSFAPPDIRPLAFCVENFSISEAPPEAPR